MIYTPATFHTGATVRNSVDFLKRVGDFRYLPDIGWYERWQKVKPDWVGQYAGEFFGVFL